MLSILGKALLIAAFAFVVELVAIALVRASRMQPYDHENNHNTQSRADQPTDEDESWEALWQRTKRDPVAFFTAVLAISTILLFVIAIGQLWFLVGADRTANRAATAAENSAKTGKDALISVQRAFVFINTFESHVVNAEYRITPQRINSGSTPANPFRNYVSWLTFSGSPPSDYNFPDLDRNGQPLPRPGEGLITFIGPHATQYADILRIPISIMEEVRAGRQHLFVWGWAEYRDAFAGTPLHRTEFCDEVEVTDMGKDETSGKVTVAINMPMYKSHNSAK